MTKAKRNISNEIIQEMENAVSFMRGKKARAVVHKVKIPDNIDVKKIRQKLHLSRQKFADKFGFSVRTLQHWEQGDRHPQGPARVLLVLLQRDPVAIASILSAK
jgi:putative transcriptional regulator